MSTPTPPPTWLSRIAILRSGPLALGFLATIGVLLALVVGGAVAQVASILTLIFLAIFISLGLYPLVTSLERRRVPRAAAIAIVIAGFGILVGAMLLIVVPVVTDEAGELIRALPGHVAGVEDQQWFIDVNERYNDYPHLLLEWIRASAADPAVWIVIGGGVIGLVQDVINGTFSAVLVIALTLYFVASLDTMKQALYELVPGSKVAGFKEIAEEIAESIGKYLSGQVLLAAMTAVVSVTVMLIMGLPYAAVVGFVGLLLALIPVIGNVIVTVLMVFVALFTSPLTAVIVAVIMIVYMQIEAYVIAPRVIGKAIHIPAALVLIGAVAGGALMGLLGALVAAPVVASILLIIKKVVVPQQRLK